MKSKNLRKAQTLAEYFLLVVAILLAVVSARFIDRFRTGCVTYFTVNSARLVIGE
ncbi:MAG: hypothetical protein KBA46_01200 [Candidatus Omnitrophica bacterium]|nr:hypothetical protein [Candidatus Omnitrophota bacterium]